jgi:predicted protein tyrosine phosphatase
MSRKSRRVLFVCEGNRHRSPTAEKVYRAVPGLRTKSAGVSPLARVRLTEELIEWADLVVVMDDYVLNLVRNAFGGRLDEAAVVCIDVPDEYQRMEPALVQVLIERLAPHIGQPGDNEPK